MPDGGSPSTEEIGRKNQLAESTARDSRFPFAPPGESGKQETIKPAWQNKPSAGLDSAVGPNIEAETQEFLKSRGGNFLQTISQQLFMNQNRGESQALQENEDDEEEDQDESEDGDESEEENSEQMESGQTNEAARKGKLENSQQKSRLAKMNEKMEKSADMLESVIGKEEMSNLRGRTQKKFNKWARTGLEELSTGILNALDLGSAGTSIVGTIFGYAITLTDLNAQMIWGYYIKHGKSFLIPALDWEPIPMPKIVTPRILHLGLVLVDLFVFGVITILFTLALLIMFLPQILLAGGLISAVSAWSFLSSFVF